MYCGTNKQVRQARDECRTEVYTSASKPPMPCAVHARICIMPTPTQQAYAAGKALPGPDPSNRRHHNLRSRRLRYAPALSIPARPCIVLKLHNGVKTSNAWNAMHRLACMIYVSRFIVGLVGL